MVQCSDKSLYTGITCDLDRRVREHNGGSASKYTRCRRPVSLVFSQDFPDRSSASKAEYRVKRYSKKVKLQLIRGGLAWDDVAGS